ncbi:MAG: hypothetical protein LBE62_13215 [Azonexus sp.]|jgi:hypothetical protein|nr:hypothetical protein [Azonexus sp.]
MSDFSMIHKIAPSTLIAISVFLGTCLNEAHAAELDESAIFQAVENVVSDYKVLVTCQSLEPFGYEVAKETWSRQVKSGAETIKNLKPSATLIARFLAAVQPSRLLDKNMPLSDAMTYCHKKQNQELVKNFMAFDFPDLSKAIEKAANIKQSGK